MSQQTFIALLNNQSIQKRSDITGIFAKNYGIAIIENNDIPFGKIKITWQLTSNQIVYNLTIEFGARAQSSDGKLERMLPQMAMVV